VTVDDEEYFENLVKLVEHYQQDADGLCCRLKHSVKKTSGNIEYTVSVQDFKESMFNLEGEILPIGS
jgi:c-src tyrosine kinase